MKKLKIVLFCFVTINIFSCAVTPKVFEIFDDSVSLENSSRISAGNAGEIVSYNDIPVSWKNKNLVLPDMIQIPAGKTTLEWNISSQDANFIYFGKNMIFIFDFKPNKQYFFRAGKEDKYGLHVWAYNFDEKIPPNMYNTEHYVGFFPFMQ